MSPQNAPSERQNRQFTRRTAINTAVRLFFTPRKATAFSRDVWYHDATVQQRM